MKHSQPCYVIGGGGHAKVVIRSLQLTGHHVMSIFDDDQSKTGSALLGIPVTGPVESIRSAKPLPTVIAVGNNAVRKKLAESLQLEWLSVIHPTAFVDETVRLGSGTMVMAGCVVQPDCQIGHHAIINTSASIDHDTHIGPYCHVAPGCHIAGDCRLDEGCMMGIGASMLPGRSIGTGSTVGGGSCVTRDIPADCVAKGVPARWT